MSRPDTWMPFYVSDYYTDTTHLPDAEAHGAYLLLLFTCWKRGGTLPDDDVQWSTIAKLKPQRWKALKGMLRGFFTQTEDGNWTQKRVTKELEKARGLTQERSKAGASGAARRWQKDASAIAKNGSAIANGSQDDGPSPSPSPKESAGEARANEDAVKVCSRLRALVSDEQAILGWHWADVAALMGAGYTEIEITGAVEKALARGKIPSNLKYFEPGLREGRLAKAPPKPKSNFAKIAGTG